MNWFSKLFDGEAQAAVPLSSMQQQLIADWRSLPQAELGRAHHLNRYIVVDVETTGLNMDKDKLISIGAVAVVNGLIDFHDAFAIVLRQDEVSADENILLHGIGASAQRDGVSPPDALIAFLQYAGKSPLVAYHARFDQHMIEDAITAHLGIKLDQAWIDLAAVMPDLFRDHTDEQVDLDYWLSIFGVENIQRHNAVSDAYATAQLLQVAMARGAQRHLETPASFISVEKSFRWMRRNA